jgi:hypothetical protein
MKWIEYAWRCDQCLEVVRRPAGGLDSFSFREEPPAPWREATFPGWAGGFLVCSDKCQTLLEERYARPIGAPPSTGKMERRLALPIQLIMVILTILEDVAKSGNALQDESDRAAQALRKAMGQSR